MERREQTKTLDELRQENTYLLEQCGELGAKVEQLSADIEFVKFNRDLGLHGAALSEVSEVLKLLSKHVSAGLLRNDVSVLVLSPKFYDEIKAKYGKWVT